MFFFDNFFYIFFCQMKTKFLDFKTARPPPAKLPTALGRDILDFVKEKGRPLRENEKLKYKHQVTLMYQQNGDMDPAAMAGFIEWHERPPLPREPPPMQPPPPPPPLVQPPQETDQAPLASPPSVKSDNGTLPVPDNGYQSTVVDDETSKNNTILVEQETNFNGWNT